MKLKSVFRKDGKLFRLFRLMWQRGTVGDGKGYSCKLSLAVYPRAYRFERDWQEWRLWLCGLRIHFQRSFGGIHT